MRKKAPQSGRSWSVAGGAGRDHSVLMEVEVDKVQCHEYPYTCMYTRGGHLQLPSLENCAVLHCIHTCMYNVSFSIAATPVRDISSGQPSGITSRLPCP